MVNIVVYSVKKGSKMQENVFYVRMYFLRNFNIYNHMITDHMKFYDINSVSPCLNT